MLVAGGRVGSRQARRPEISAFPEGIHGAMNQLHGVFAQVPGAFVDQVVGQILDTTLRRGGMGLSQERDHPVLGLSEGDLVQFLGSGGAAAKKGGGNEDSGNGNNGLRDELHGANRQR